MAVTDFSVANIADFTLISGAAAYDITLPFEADTIEWWNYTKYGTNTNNISGIWFAGMPAGDALIVTRGTTTLTSTQETTNGVTELPDGSGFAATNVTPTAINVTTSVVTVAANTWKTGQFVRGLNFRSTPVADATGCYGLNNRVFQLGAVSGTTFELLEPYTNVKADLTGETAFVNNGVAKFNLIGQALGTVNPAPVFQYTLGTAVMGADGDVIYIRAMKANQVTNLGDVG